MHSTGAHKSRFDKESGRGSRTGRASVGEEGAGRTESSGRRASRGSNGGGGGGGSGAATARGAAPATGTMRRVTSRQPGVPSQRPATAWSARVKREEVVGTPEKLSEEQPPPGSPPEIAVGAEEGGEVVAKVAVSAEEEPISDGGAL